MKLAISTRGDDTYIALRINRMGDDTAPMHVQVSKLGTFETINEATNYASTQYKGDDTCWILDLASFNCMLSEMELSAYGRDWYDERSDNNV